MRALTASDRIVLAQEADFLLGGLTVRPSKRQVIAGDASEILQPRIMQVLVALARRRGQVVSRDELMASCWGGFAVSDDAIHRCIARLRRLSEAHGGFRLETIPRVGYQLVELGAAQEIMPPRAWWKMLRLAAGRLITGTVLFTAGYFGASLF